MKLSIDNLSHLIVELSQFHQKMRNSYIETEFFFIYLLQKSIINLI